MATVKAEHGWTSLSQGLASRLSPLLTTSTFFLIRTLSPLPPPYFLLPCSFDEQSSALNWQEKSLLKENRIWRRRLYDILNPGRENFLMGFRGPGATLAVALATRVRTIDSSEKRSLFFSRIKRNFKLVYELPFFLGACLPPFLRGKQTEFYQCRVTTSRSSPNSSLFLYERTTVQLHRCSYCSYVLPRSACLLFVRRWTMEECISINSSSWTQTDVDWMTVNDEIGEEVTTLVFEGFTKLLLYSVIHVYVSRK